MAKKTHDKKIKRIGFLFENFENVIFNADQIKYVHISDIYEEIYVANKSVHCKKTAGRCEICLFPKADIPIISFTRNPVSAFKRLKGSNDITQLTITYTDCSEEIIYPCWVGMKECENEAQGCIEKKNGSLIVYVIRGKKKRRRYISWMQE